MVGQGRGSVAGEVKAPNNQSVGHALVLLSLHTILPTVGPNPVGENAEIVVNRLGTYPFLEKWFASLVRSLHELLR